MGQSFQLFQQKGNNGAINRRPMLDERSRMAIASLDGNRNGHYGWHISVVPGQPHPPQTAPGQPQVQKGRVGVSDRSRLEPRLGTVGGPGPLTPEPPALLGPLVK